MPSLTPMQTVRSMSRPGAETTTRRAPAPRWAAASPRERKCPLASMTTSTPWSAQGILAGSSQPVTAISCPRTRSLPSVASTSTPSRPATESCSSRNASVSASAFGSLTATTSIPGAGSRPSRTRSNDRPIRPKPFMPTRTVMVVSSRCVNLSCVPRVDCIPSMPYRPMRSHDFCLQMHVGHRGLLVAVLAAAVAPADRVIDGATDRGLRRRGCRRVARSS